MTFDWSIIWQSMGALWQGALVTIGLTVLTMVLAVPLGIVVALLRDSRLKPVSALATAYVELMRNVPIILVVYWAFYVLPILTGVGFSPFLTGLVALVLNNTAYNSETFRSGIRSIRPPRWVRSPRRCTAIECCRT